MGVADADRRYIVDVDECGVYYANGDRERGYAFLGHKATLVRKHYVGKKLNVLLAVTQFGVVAWWVYPMNTTSKVRRALCSLLVSCDIRCLRASRSTATSCSTTCCHGSAATGTPSSLTMPHSTSVM